MNIIINSLIILKSLIDSLVYAIRNQEIHRALVRMKVTLCCGRVEPLESRQSLYASTKKKDSSDYGVRNARGSCGADHLQEFKTPKNFIQNSVTRNGNSRQGHDNSFI